ncbi:T9SS type A sorting domain-containing protein [Flexithrix dorotheae]|uniref:T9SS type A sorting domain-containing protein n=1 Tax=Flexithrix dorotheae TaxID=70993 RepID=UPI000367A307|nr:T9SS type A sorting domain-containing protein [Flexithrix dorotheae]
MNRLLLVAIIIIGWSCIGYGQNINTLEYFFDTDPGYGNGKKISITAATDINQSLLINSSGLSEGMHTLYYRLQNDLGSWSFTGSHSFLIIHGEKQITQIEYFFDTDPGIGKGNIMNVSFNTTSEYNIPIDIEDIQSGLHVLFVRVQDSLGMWSFLQRNTILITEEKENSLKKLEYFFDNDPGFGEGKSIDIMPSDKDIDSSFAIELDSVLAGDHLLQIRVVDGNGSWSLTNNKNISFCGDPIYFNLIQNGIDNLSATFTLLSDKEGLHQWYKNGEPIEEARENEYPVTDGGVYYAIVTNEDSCIIALSDTVVLTSSYDYLADHGQDISIYPNPILNNLYIKVKSGLNYSYVIKLLSLDGKAIYETEVKKTKMIQDFDISHLRKGIYLLKVVGRDINITRKVRKE